MIDARTFISFWKSKMGMLTLFMAGLLGVILVAKRGVNSTGVRQGATPTHAPVAVAAEKGADVYTRQTVPLELSPEQRRALEKPNDVERQQLAQKKAAVAPTPPPPPTPTPKPERLKLYSSFGTPGAPEKRDTEESQGGGASGLLSVRPRKSADRYAPFGRLVKCELVNTVDSAKQETPMIGLVTEDVWWDGRLIIPVGSEVHGTAAINKQNPDRIGSTEKWVIVLPVRSDLPHGSELTVRGVALDMSDARGDREMWGITDGSFGIQGYTIKSDNLEEVKLFVSTFLAEAANALQTRQQGAFGGSILESTPQNALLSGTGAVLNEYAKQVMEEIKENGSYTRVPAGKQFYLYIRQTLALEEAKIGDSDTKIRDFEKMQDKNASGFGALLPPALQQMLGGAGAQGRPSTNPNLQQPPLQTAPIPGIPQNSNSQFRAR